MKTPPWTRQKAVDWNDMPSQREIRELIMHVQDPRDQFVLGILYLTGARASEITSLTDRTVQQETIKDIPCIKFTLHNRKNRTQHEKILALPISLEPEICARLFAFTDKMAPGALLTPKTRQSIWQICVKYTDWNPHVFRHLCLSFLVTRRGFRDIDLTRWAGWTDMRPASGYVKYRYQDFIKNEK